MIKGKKQNRTLLSTFFRGGEGGKHLTANRKEVKKMEELTSLLLLRRRGGQQKMVETVLQKNTDQEKNVLIEHRKMSG